MPCPKATRGIHRVYINYLLAHPAGARAPKSKVLREHLDHHRYLTPHFSYSEMADTRSHKLVNRSESIKHCWNLERFARGLGRHRRRGHGSRVSVSIDGPSRTSAHNVQVGGASDSRHTHGDASDHFITQVQRWERETGLSKSAIISIAKKHFTAIGNENSGTLHLDSRPGAKGSILFVNWTPAR